MHNSESLIATVILLQHYFEKGRAPTIIHCITTENTPKAPKDQPIELLPLRWQTYLSNVSIVKNIILRKIQNSLMSFEIHIFKQFLR